MAKDWEYKANNAKHSQLVKTFDSWSRQELIDSIIDLKKQLAKLESHSLPDNLTESKSTAPSFNKAWSVPTKIVFILARENKPLKSADIFSHLITLDKSFLDFNLPKTVLSNYLTRSCKSGRIARIKNGGIREHYFALPDWTDDKGKLKETYKTIIEKF